MIKKMLLCITILLLLSACTATQESDQGFTVRTKIDTNLYSLDIEVSNEVLSHSALQGIFASGTMYGYGRIWQDGKGLLRGKLLALDKPVDFASVGDEIIVKTTDLKIMAVHDGEIVSLICTVDYEPICAYDPSGMALGECYDLWEFDFCRMVSFKPLD